MLIKIRHIQFILIFSIVPIMMMIIWSSGLNCVIRGHLHRRDRRELKPIIMTMRESPISVSIESRTTLDGVSNCSLFNFMQVICIYILGMPQNCSILCYQLGDNQTAPVS